MTEMQSQPPFASATVPPQVPGQIPARSTVWPTVIGVILIVLGSVGILTNLCGGVAAPLMPLILSKIMPAKAQSDPIMTAQIDIAQRYLPFTLANAVILLTLGVVVLSAGIKIAKRRRGGAGLAIGWAISRIIWALPASYITYVMSIDTFDTMQKAAANSAQGLPPGFNTMMQSFGVIGVIVGLAISCAMPAFVLIWFAVPRFRSEAAQWQR